MVFARQSIGYPYAAPPNVPADRLEAIVRERKAFDRARRRALARLRKGLDLQWTPPKSRDELHER